MSVFCFKNNNSKCRFSIENCRVVQCASHKGYMMDLSFKYYCIIALCNGVKLSLYVAVNIISENDIICRKEAQTKIALLPADKSAIFNGPSGTRTPDLPVMSREL